jgi:hypothetical protein
MTYLNYLTTFWLILRFLPGLKRVLVMGFPRAWRTINSRPPNSRGLFSSGSQQ